MATQERHPGSVRASDTAPATLPEIGIPRQRASEMKKLAEAGEDRIRDEVKQATSEGRRPSRRNLLDRIPAIAARPPEFTQFALWLRTGAEVRGTAFDKCTVLDRLTRQSYRDRGAGASCPPRALSSGPTAWRALASVGRSSSGASGNA